MNTLISVIETPANNAHDKLVTFGDKNQLFVYKGLVKRLSAE
jgi:hypothetical protein